ncbi:MAG: ferredoxin [Myxococcota bacterium]
MKIRVDLDLCQGHEVCVSEAADVFAFDRKRGKVEIRRECPDPEQHARVRLAVRYCPTHALSIEED